MLVFKYIKECKKSLGLFNLDSRVWDDEKFVTYDEVDLKRFARECVWGKKKMCIGIYDEDPIVVDRGDYKRMVVFNAEPCSENYVGAVHVGIVKKSEVLWDAYLKYSPGKVFVTFDKVLDFSYKENRGM